MTNDEIINEAKSVTKSRRLSFNNTAGSVGAAILTNQGNIFRGVCIDTGSSMGFCAEHSAVGSMITAGETQIVKVVAVWHDDGDGTWYVLPPCGRCREFMKQINEKNLDAEVVLGNNDSMKLSELLPRYEWPNALKATHI